MKRVSWKAVCLKALLFSGLCCLLSTNSFAQLPATRLDAVSPLGGTPGSTFDLVIQGNDLDNVDRLIFSAPGISAEPKLAEKTEFDETPLPVPNTFVVTIAPDAPLGVHEVRCQGFYGLSNPRRFIVESVPQSVEIEPNNDPELATEIALPIAVHGRSEGNADVDYFRFTGTGGERVSIRVEARTIDSRMEPRLALLDSLGNTIAQGRPGADGETRIDLRLPGNGSYFVKIHDALYQQGSGYVYRLCVGPWPRIESVYPPSILPGTTARVTVYGFGLPGGVDSEFDLDGARLQKLELDVSMPNDVSERVVDSGRIEAHQSLIDAIDMRVGNAPFQSEPFRIASAGAPVVLEQEGNNAPEAAQSLTLPCEVAGRFYPRGDVDWYSFEAEQGDVWFIDVVSNRLGWPSDPSLLVQQLSVDEQGVETVKNVVFLDDVPRPNDSQTRSGRHEFDVRSTDPSYRFEAPAKGRYRIFLRDAAASARSDARWTYRLTVRRPTPDYRVVAVPADSSGGLVLRRGARDLIRLNVARIDGFSGEIRVNAVGLPAGLSASEVTIGPESEMATLVITAAADAPLTNGVLQLSAKALIDGREVVHAVRYGQATAPWQFQQPNSQIPSVPARLMSQLQWCVIDSEPSFAQVRFADGSNQVFETCRGGIIKVPYAVTKQEGLQGNLQGFLIDVPLGTQAQQINLADTGEVELRFNQQTPPGEFSIYLAGFMQNMRYERNPAATALVKARQERINSMLEQARQSEQQMNTAAQQAQQMLTQRTQAATTAEQALNTAKQQFAQAEQALNQAMEAAKRTADAAAAAPDDAGAKQAAETAAAQLTTTTTAFEEAQKKLADAQTAFDTAVSEREAATIAKQAADQALVDARAFTQRAQQEKQRTDQQFQQAQQLSNPRNINEVFPSNSITLRIAPYPIVPTDLPAETALTPGTPSEIIVGFERKYEFTGAVNLQVQLPAGVNGIQVNAPAIPDQQVQGPITITASPNATPGRHQANLRMQMNMNGANLQLDRPLIIVVPEPAPDPAN